VTEPESHGSKFSLSIAHKKPASVKLFNAENVNVIESEVVVPVTFITGSSLPSIADSIIVSILGTTFQTKVAGAVSFII
jgi:hypothetical protein